MKNFFASLVAVTLMIGCTTTPPPVVLATPQPRLTEQSYKISEVTIPVLNATEKEFTRFTNEFATAPDAVQRAVPLIICYRSPEDTLSPAVIARISALAGPYMAEKVCSINNERHWKDNQAHCHLNRVICLMQSRFQDGSLRHEMLHAFMFSMSREAVAHSHLKWLEAAYDPLSKLYPYVGSVWWLIAGDFPRDGFLNAYAMSEEDEDIAIMTKAAYCFLRKEGLRIVDPFLGVNRNDGRYAAKIKVLYGMGAITKAEYEAATVRLTPLHAQKEN